MVWTSFFGARAAPTTPSSGLQDQSWEDTRDELSMEPMHQLERDSLSLTPETQSKPYTKAPPLHQPVIKEEFPVGKLASTFEMRAQLEYLTLTEDPDPLIESLPDKVNSRLHQAHRDTTRGQGSVIKAVVQDLQQQEEMLSQIQSGLVIDLQHHEDSLNTTQAHLSSVVNDIGAAPPGLEGTDLWGAYNQLALQQSQMEEQMAARLEKRLMLRFEVKVKNVVDFELQRFESSFQPQGQPLLPAKLEDLKV